MRLLILGGTGFIGRHFTERALARGWDVTHFNRGQSNPDAYPAVTSLRGDRKEDLSALDGLSFDSVIDTACYFPRDVVKSAMALRGNVPHYVFISSISAYADSGNDPINEQSPLAPWDEALGELTEITPEAYGPLKAECERQVQAIYGNGALVIRPGLIIGRYDPTGRFSYWPQRFRKGGRILVPARENAPTQFIDAHDIAEWVLDLCAAKTGGAFNATGPIEATTIGAVLNRLMELAPAGTELVPLSDEVLLEHGVGPWMELPLWLPESANSDGMMKADLSGPRAAGLRTRPLEETLSDILDEIATTGFKANQSLTAEKETAVLRAAGH